MTLHAKIAMSDLQRYPWNLRTIKNVEEVVVFLDRNLFNFNNFSIALYKQEMRKSLSQRIRKQTLKSFKKTKTWKLTHIWLANVFKGTVVNCNLCMEGHLKLLLITFIKVLRGGKKVCWIWVWTRKNVILKRFKIRRFPWRELIFLNLLGTVVFNGYRGR